jgi:hypothetical protein
MKPALMFMLVFQMLASAQDLKDQKALKHVNVIHLATSLDHLTVLEFGEPVTMAAAGSPAFQIERHEDRVFIKPLKPGTSTDLFIWTATRRFTYELEPPGEVKDMNFAIDSAAPQPRPTPDNRGQIQDIADMMLAKALLGAERIDSRYIKDTEGRITVRIEHVFQSSNSIYIHYSMRNLTNLPYRIVMPAVSELSALRPSISVEGLKHSQLPQRTVRGLGELKPRAVAVARSEVQQADLQPGTETPGLLIIREPVASPIILRLDFGPEGKHPVEAVLVF